MGLKTLFRKTTGIMEKPASNCPNCTHGIIHRLVGEVLEEMDILEDTVEVVSADCSVLSYEYFHCDMTQAPAGRAPAVATGVKLVLPDRFVFTYQGDGDLALGGISEVIHAAARGEKITVIFVNDSICDVTRGQMVPTGLRQKTATTPYGRHEGSPIKVCEMLATLDGSAYIERVSIHDVPHIEKTKKAIRKAFEIQQSKLGFSMIEVLSTCPANWGLDSQESLEWVKDNMIPVFPLGVYKDKGRN